ncbi:MAG: DMT family transporter [Patescibacteria group bacterium]
MSWLIIAIIAYFLLAITNVNDKMILAKSLPQQSYLAYTFYVCFLGGLVIVMAPWGWGLISWPFFLWALFGGALAVSSLFYFYKSLSNGQASIILPFFGAATAIFTLILSYLFLAEKLTTGQLGSFIFLIIGIGLIALAGREPGTKLNFYPFWLSTIAALLSGLYYVVTKYLFNELGFVNGFVWLRLFAALLALALIIPRANRQIIFAKTGELTGKLKLLFVANQGIGATGFILVNYAISLASVALVNALLGLQYAFVLVIVLVLGARRPRLTTEKNSGQVLITKILAIIIIGLGLFCLAYFR